MGSMDTVTLTVRTKIDITTETAELCLRLLEAWVNADPGRKIEMEMVDTGEGLEYRYRLNPNKWRHEEDANDNDQK